MCRFTLTPQRMRIIVDAFMDTLDIGLKEHDQIVVCPIPLLPYVIVSLSIFHSQ